MHDFNRIELNDKSFTFKESMLEMISPEKRMLVGKFIYSCYRDTLAK